MGKTHTYLQIAAIFFLLLTAIVTTTLSALTSTVSIKTSGSIAGSLAGVTATSGSATDIQAAVDYILANGGRGNVYIPAGTFNFVEVGEPWRTVYIPPGVNLYGAPTERDTNGQVIEWKTILRMPYDVPGSWSSIPSWFKLGNGGQDPNKPIRFSDVKIQGYRSINPSSVTLHKAIQIYGVMDYRIDHVCIENCAGGGIEVPPYLQQNLKCRGVIDHCRIYNTAGINDLAQYTNGNVGYGVQLQRAYSGVVFDATMDVLGHYTDYTCFIEDSYFSMWRHCVASGHGAFYVFRYNTISGDFPNTYSLDVHGLRDLEANRAGGRGCEIYENRLVNLNYNLSPIHNRGILQSGGGCGVWFNNYVDTTYSTFQLFAEDYVASETWHLKDFYFWGNTGPLTPFFGYPSGTIDPSRNVVADWTRNAGTVDDANYPNANPSWTIAGYKPYVYPHPLNV